MRAELSGESLFASNVPGKNLENRVDCTFQVGARTQLLASEQSTIRRGLTQMNADLRLLASIRGQTHGFKFGQHALLKVHLLGREARGVWVVRHEHDRLVQLAIQG